MLAYAAETRPAGRAGSPKALTLILAGHAILISAVMTAKMDLVPVDPFSRTDLINIPIEPPPPPEPATKVEPEARQAITQERFIEPERTIVDMNATIPSTAFDQGQLDDIISVIGSGPTTIPLDPPKPVRIAARFTTPDSMLKPPYPLDKRRAEEEAMLRLKLSIDARGRVVAVEPVGPADASFLEAARRHIVRAWRYRPAMEDGVAAPSSTAINLSFRLEDV
jgi:protein TonB